MPAETPLRGRPRLFDEETALDRITELFWKQGYSQTTVADLVEVSGVHKPSLYRTFGTKEELFATVLRRYRETRMGMFAGLIESTGPGIEGIQEFLTLLHRELNSGSSQDGCLLVASSAELHGTTPSFENFGSIYRDALRDLLRPLVAKAGGNDAVITQRTTLLATWFLGVDITRRGCSTADEIDQTLDAMRATVDTWR